MVIYWRAAASFPVCISLLSHLMELFNHYQWHCHALDDDDEVETVNRRCRHRLTRCLCTLAKTSTSNAASTRRRRTCCSGSLTWDGPKDSSDCLTLSKVTKKRSNYVFWINQKNKSTAHRSCAQPSCPRLSLFLLHTEREREREKQYGSVSICAEISSFPAGQSTAATRECMARQRDTSQKK